MAQLVIKLPDVGEGTAQAELTNWLVKVGDTVTEDQILAEVTTDKATVEVPAPLSGKVVTLHGTPGDKIAVGARLVELETEGSEPLTSESPKLRDGLSAATEKPRQSTGIPSKASIRPLASPAVRARAADLGIDLGKIVGSAAGGRIIHKDLDTFLIYQRRTPVEAPTTTAPTSRPSEVFALRETKIIGVRRMIAERMQEAKRRIPHFSYVEEIDVTALEDLRSQLNADGDAARPKISVLPFVVAALARAIPEFPLVNSHFDDDAGILREFDTVHAGIATQTDKGLVVPVVFHAGQRDLWSIADEIARVAQAARDGTAKRAELTGSTITVTSLGKLGGIMATPVINRPEVAIVGINKIVQRPVIRDGQIVSRAMMNLSSSFDHRIIDGWVAAAFIQRIKALLEQPARLLRPV